MPGVGKPLLHSRDAVRNILGLAHSEALGDCTELSPGHSLPPSVQDRPICHQNQDTGGIQAPCKPQAKARCLAAGNH